MSWTWLVGGPADREPQGRPVRLAPQSQCRARQGVGWGHVSHPGGDELGVTSDALSYCKVLRGEDGKRVELGASVFTCLGSTSDRSLKLTLQFAGGDTRGQTKPVTALWARLPGRVPAHHLYTGSEGVAHRCPSRDLPGAQGAVSLEPHCSPSFLGPSTKYFPTDLPDIVGKVLWNWLCGHSEVSFTLNMRVGREKHPRKRCFLNRSHQAQPLR